MSTSTAVPGERRQQWLARASVLLVGLAVVLLLGFALQRSLWLLLVAVLAVVVLANRVRGVQGLGTRVMKALAGDH